MTGASADRGASQAALLFVAIPIACEGYWLAHGVALLPRWAPDLVVLTGLMVGVTLGWRYWRHRDLAPSPVGERGGWAMDLALLLVLAAPFRLVGLEHHPWYVDYDEGLNGTMSAELWALDDWRVVEPRLGIETPYLYLLAIARGVLGMSVWSLRLPGALVGTATVLAIYGFARALLGRSVGRWAGALAAVSPLMVYSSRLAMHAVMVGLLVAVTYALLWSARARVGRARWALVGALGGLSLYTFTSYRHGPAVVVVAALVVGIPRAAWWPFASGLALAALPFAIASGGTVPTDWTGVLASGSAVATAIEARDPMILVHAAVASIPPALVVLPAHDTGLGIFLGMAVAFGLPALLKWRDLRCRLLAWLLLSLTAPGGIARFHHTAPRRFLGITPALFTLAAWTLLDLRSRLAPRARRWFTVWLVFLLTVLALRVVEHTHAMGRNVGAPADHPQRALRAALEQAADHEVFLPPGFTRDLPDRRYYLLHPQVHELARAAPWEIGPGERPALLLDAQAELSSLVAEVYPSLVPTRVARPDGGESLAGGRIPAAARRSFDAPSAPVEGGTVAIDADACYAYDAPDGAGFVEIGSGRALAPGQEVWLAAGLHRYRYPGPAAPPPRLVARGGRSGGVGRPLVDVVAPSFVASPTRWAGFGFFDAHLVDLARGGGAWLVAPQDLKATPDALFLAYYGGIRRYDSARRAIDPEWAARDESGEPIGEAFTDQPGELAGRSYSVAPLPGGELLVAQAQTVVGARRLPGWVRRLDLRGRSAGAFAPGHAFEEPCDLSVASDGRVAVCDARAGRAYVFDARGELLHAHRFARPVALAWDGDALLVADAARFELARIEAGGARWRAFVGALSPRARLRVGPGGDALLADGGVVVAFDRGLSRLVVGDRFAHVLPADYGLLSQLDWAADGVVWVLDGAHNLHRLESVLPGADARIDRAAAVYDRRAYLGGTLTVAPDGALVSQGGATPSGRIAAGVTIAGRYRVWACWAATTPGPFVIAASGQVLAVSGHATGGDARSDARWSRAGELDLDAGTVELALGAEGAFVRLYAIALERVDR